MLACLLWPAVVRRSKGGGAPQGDPAVLAWAAAAAVFATRTMVCPRVPTCRAPASSPAPLLSSSLPLAAGRRRGQSLACCVGRIGSYGETSSVRRRLVGSQALGWAVAPALQVPRRDRGGRPRVQALPPGGAVLGLGGEADGSLQLGLATSWLTRSASTGNSEAGCRG